MNNKMETNGFDINKINVDKKLGFGFFRLPLIGDKVDLEECKNMVDVFMSSGFNYFDVARPYMNEQSESTFKECVAKRYPREQYIIANKLTHEYFNSEKDIYDLFENQLNACGVDYFDIYLMHCQIRANRDHFKKNRAYEIAQELKKQGKIKYVGFSYHDNAEYLEQLLNEHPEIDVVQLQINYYDYESEIIQSRKNLEVCKKYNKPVIVMEPVKGGMLAKIPHEAEKIFEQLSDKKSNASYALRFAAGCDGVVMVLSGMSNLDQMKDNLSYMDNFEPLSEAELAILPKVKAIIDANVHVQCTGCRYCVKGCPNGIKIPDLMALLNSKLNVKYNNQLDQYYWTVYTYEAGKASDCIKCGKCEVACPQHLQIREYLEETKRIFETQEGYFDELKERLILYKEKNNGFIIYGAGKMGKIAAQYFKENLSELNVISVAVSEKVEDNQFFEGYPLSQIDKLTKYNKSALVLVVTINPTFIHEMYIKLETLGFENILNLYS